jgi:non-ribosomal peptide synthase protein (TIGR01720 family)
VLRDELSYWAPEARARVKPLPRDLHRATNTLASSRSVYALLEFEETRILLQQVPRVWKSQIQEVLLAAMLQVVARWSGNQLLQVDLEGHGREGIFEGVDLSRTVGWFTTLYPMFFDLREADSLAEVLERVREAFDTLPNRGVGYGVLRYTSEDPETRGRLRAMPGAEISFNYLGQFDQVVPEASAFKPARESTGAAHSGRGARSHVFEINSMVVGGRLRLSWGYSQNLHQRSSAEDLVARYAEVLRQLVAECRPAETEAAVAPGFEDFAWSESEVRELAAAIESSSSANEVFEE